MSVVVTGVGVVSAAGAGFEPFRAALANGALEPVEVERPPQHHLEGEHPLGGAPARLALRVPADAWRGWIAPNKARRMSAPSRFAVAAAREAVTQAGLGAGEGAATVLGEALDPSRAAISLGTAFGSTEVTHKILGQCVEPGPEAISPALFTESVASAHAGQIGLELGLRGANATLTQGEASTALALLHGAELIDSGRADVVLAGGVDEASPLLHAVLDRSGALARDAGYGERPRPFDPRRNGFLLSEGATVCVLESEDHARRRGATALVRLVARARAFDPTARPGRFGSGDAWATPLRAALERAGVPLGSLDAIVASAAGTVHGDAAEAAFLRGAFGADVPPVLIPKASVGEFGGLSAAAALHAACGGEVPTGDVDARGLAVASAAAGPRVLASSLASGGPGAWLVWEACGED